MNITYKGTLKAKFIYQLNDSWGLTYWFFRKESAEF
jgi:hypothetical protein